MNRAQIRSILNAISPFKASTPMVIVGGMPKSGTTAIARLLASATGLSASSDPFYQIDVGVGGAARRSLYSGDMHLEAFWKRYQQFFKGEVVKDPNFPFFLEDLLAMFPPSKQVFIVRDPRDNIRSILDRLGLNGKTQPGDDAYKAVSGTWRNVLEGRMPELAGDDFIEKMAWRWRVCAENYLEHQSRCTLIRYEDFKKDKKAGIEDLVRQLGFNCEHDISNKVDVQYQPKGKQVTDWDSYFGSEALQRIDTIVRPHLEVFGYDR